MSSTVAFAPWTPDVDDWSTGMVPDVDGVLPGTNGYYPWPELDAVSSPLPARPFGAALLRVNAVPEAFAGTHNKLYRFNAGNGGWSDVSGTGYTADETQPWQFAVFGDRVVALSAATEPQTFKPAVESAFSDLANAPRGQALGVWGEHLAIGAGNVIHGSSVNDPEVWAPLSTNTAFEQEFKDGGEVKGFSNSNNPIIVQQSAIRRGSLVGGAQRIVFDVAAEGIGTDHGASIARFGAALFFWANTGFVMVDPTGAVTNIGANKVDIWFRSHADQDRRIQGWPDVLGRRVLWAFHEPLGGANFDQIICYDLATQQWSRVTYKVAEFAGVAPTGLRLNAIDIPIDDVEGSFDDSAEIYAFGAFDRDFNAGTFTGAPLPASITTAEFPQTGAGRTRLHWAMPQADLDQAQVQVLQRERRGQAFVPQPFVALNRNGHAPLRQTSRFFRLKVRFPGTYPWTWATGLEVESSPEGEQ